MHCDVTNLMLHITQGEISQERSKTTNFCKRSYQPILRYLYAEAIKRRGKISLHRHFKVEFIALIALLQPF